MFCTRVEKWKGQRERLGEGTAPPLELRQFLAQGTQHFRSYMLLLFNAKRGSNKNDANDCGWK
jgi:hypothetical protein